MLALLPLTIDRAIAIALPLRHRSFINKTNCVCMFGMNWLPLLILLLYDTVAYIEGTVTILYYNKYHRCVISGRNSYIEQMCLLFVPFLLVLLMYSIMLVIIVRKRRRCGWFLVTSTGIIVTSMLSYSPTVISNVWNIPLRYEVSQILTVTLYYTNGITNPLVYVFAHPVTRNYIKTLRFCRCLAGSTVSTSMVQSSVIRSGFEHYKGRNNLGVLVPSTSSPVPSETIYLSKI